MFPKARPHATPHRESRGRFRSLPYKVATLLLMTFSVLGITALPASAHHPEIGATLQCDGTVSWTSTSWAPGTLKGTNDHIDVYKSIGGGGYQLVTSGSYDSSDNWQFSGSFTVGTNPYPTVQLKAVAVDSWGSGIPGGQVRYTGTLRFSPDCSASKPAASVDVDCSGFVVHLSNTGRSEAVFTITKPTGDTVTVTVPAGQTRTLTYPVIQDQTASVTVSAPGMTEVVSSYTADCHHAVPTASVDVDCSGFVVTLTNMGNEDATFSITKPNGDTEQVTVSAGQTQTVSYPVISGQTSTVTVSSPGMTDVSASYAATCAAHGHPRASVKASCTGLTATLDNTSDAAVTYLLSRYVSGTLDSSSPHSVSVPAGEKVRRSYGVVEDKTVELTVTAPGMADTSTSFHADCTEVLPEQVFRPRHHVPASVAPAEVLPNTGSPVRLWMVALGLALVTMGGGLTLAQRRSRV